MSQHDSPINYQGFLIFAGICAILSAITTMLMEFLPIPPVSDFASQAALANSTPYMMSKWALFFHPQFTLFSLLGIAVLFYRKAPEFVIPAVIFAIIWAVTEAGQQALSIDAINQTLRLDYLASQSELEKQQIKTSLNTMHGISSSMFFLLVYAIGIAYLLFGLLMLRQEHRNFLLGYVMLFLSFTSFISFIGYYITDTSILTPLIDWLFTWIYPYLAPLFRIYFGYWLISTAKKYGSS